MDFMRAISILFVGINVYWFCYSSLKGWGVTFEVIDKILWNFQRTTGLFSSMLWTKLFAVVFLALSCIGTKVVHHDSPLVGDIGRSHGGCFRNVFGVGGGKDLYLSLQCRLCFPLYNAIAHVVFLAYNGDVRGSSSAGRKQQGQR